MTNINTTCLFACLLVFKSYHHLYLLFLYPILKAENHQLLIPFALWVWLMMSISNKPKCSLQTELLLSRPTSPISTSDRISDRVWQQVFSHISVDLRIGNSFLLILVTRQSKCITSLLIKPTPVILAFISTSCNQEITMKKTSEYHYYICRCN